MSDLDSVLADIKGEGEPTDFFTQRDNSEMETPAESLNENKPTEEEPSPDGAENSQDETENLPFHKHPRWKEMYESKRRLETEVAEMREQLESRMANVEAQPSLEKPELPNEFVRLYGDDPEAFRLFQKQQDGLAERIKSELRAESERAVQSEQKALQDGQRYVEDSLSDLENEGNTFDRNELMKFMLDFKSKFGALPSDENDNIDFRKGFALMQSMKPNSGEAQEKSKARKDIAAFSGESSRGRGEPKTKDYQTPADLAKMSWDSFRA